MYLGPRESRCKVNLTSLDYWWNLHHDSHTRQSGGCVSFIYDARQQMLPCSGGIGRSDSDYR
jgi:hypothetical protein